MRRKTDWPGLTSLDRRFEADYTGDQLRTLFPGEASNHLIRRGILQDAGVSLTIPRCICEFHRPECVVRVDNEGGRYRGYCNEYGAPIDVSIEQIQHYRFAWSAWAVLMRRANHLAGAGPVQGTGCLFVGEGTVAGRRYGLLVVAPGCQRSLDVVLPEGARHAGRALLGLFLGDKVQGFAVDAVLTLDRLGQDLVTIDASALERALDEVPLVVQPGETGYRMSSRASPKGIPITAAEYDRLHRPNDLKKFDLFIDLLLCKVWRKGRACGTVLDGKGRSTGKGLKGRGILLLASYVRRPGSPMRADETPVYRDAAVSPRSAAVMFSSVRRSIHGTAFLKSGARSSQPGETTYVFDPPAGMTWCLLERLPRK